MSVGNSVFTAHDEVMRWASSLVIAVVVVVDIAYVVFVVGRWRAASSESAADGQTRYTWLCRDALYTFSDAGGVPGIANCRISRPLSPEMRLSS